MRFSFIHFSCCFLSPCKFFSIQNILPDGVPQLHYIPQLPELYYPKDLGPRSRWKLLSRFCKHIFRCFRELKRMILEILLLVCVLEYRGTQQSFQFCYKLLLTLSHDLCRCGNMVLRFLDLC